MQFSTFSEYLAQLEMTPSRLEMTEILARLFGELEPAEIQQASYLLLGGLTPQYLTLEFQLSTKMILRALARVSGAGATDQDATSLFGEVDTSIVEDRTVARYKKLGDLGQLAYEIQTECKRTTSTLSILDVFQALAAIATDQGGGSQERKLLGLISLFEQLDARSAKFVTRIILGKMRLGFSTMTLLDALSWTLNHDKTDTKLLELAYQKKADIGALASTYLYGAAAGRFARLDHYSVEVGVPVVPALCQRLNTSEEIIEKMGTVFAEHKYDGLRVQIHVKKGADGFLRTFTRNLEETTHMFPELITEAQKLHCQSCILDAEAIGFDPATGALQSFQKTITRKRKHEIAEAAEAVPMRFYIFDILELDGVALIDKKLRERKDLLTKVCDDSEVLIKTKYIETSNPEELRMFHQRALAEGLEGAVIKKADSLYQSGRKGWSWVKIKEEEGTTGKLSDTLDVVVMGYYAGRGKRAAFGIGAFLTGVVNKAGEVVTIAKIGTGLTDEQLQELKVRANSLATAAQPTLYRVPKELAPDVWMLPELVVEIAADEITNSPLHSAGVALRFPRLIKFRDDKTVDQATTLHEVLQIKTQSL